MKAGIVGLPNVGKSTLYNAITNAGADSANYPFCTIEPNTGVVAVPDKRLDRLAEVYEPLKRRQPSWSSWTSPDWSGARARERASETNSSPISAKRTPLCMSCAVSTTKT